MATESTIWSGPSDRVPAGRNPLVGDVAEFDDPRGLGVIEFGTGHRIDFHCTAITDGSRHIDVGTVVAFEVSAGRLGRLEAHSVRPLPGVAQPGATLAVAHAADHTGVVSPDPFAGTNSTQPTFVEPTSAEPTTADPIQADPTQADPTQAGPTQGEPSYAEPVGASDIGDERVDEDEETVEPSAYEESGLDVPIELPGREALRRELERHAQLTVPAAAAAAASAAVEREPAVVPPDGPVVPPPTADATPVEPSPPSEAPEMVVAAPVWASPVPPVSPVAGDATTAELTPVSGVENGQPGSHSGRQPMAARWIGPSHRCGPSSGRSGPRVRRRSGRGVHGRIRCCRPRRRSARFVGAGGVVSRGAIRSLGRFRGIRLRGTG